MIYISSSCVKDSKIKYSVEQLAKQGFKNIELSGGTEYYESYLKDLIELKKQYQLNYLLHNYYPAPKQHFVCNLASLNPKIFQATVDHYKKSVEVSEILKAKKFGLHAGFLIDPHVSELGKVIAKKDIYVKEKAIEQFCKGLQTIQSFSNEVTIYVENNVFSKKNFTELGFNPFLFINYDGYLEIQRNLKFPILLDLAHLKVSCQTLGINFYLEIEKLYHLADYIHLSDNDGFSDSNKWITEKSEIYNIIKKKSLNSKTVTLEIYESMGKIINSYNLLAPSI